MKGWKLAHSEETSKRSEKPVATNGEVIGMAGGLLLASGLSGCPLGARLSVGEEAAEAEVLADLRDGTLVALYDEMTDLGTGTALSGQNEPFSIPLGPGLEGRMYDALLRPLPTPPAEEDAESSPPVIDLDRTWYFAPQVLVGDEVGPGTILGDAKNGGALRYRVMVPPNVSGTIKEMHTGERTAGGDLVTLEGGSSISMVHRWPLKWKRPFASRLPAGNIHYTVPAQRIFFQQGTMTEARGLSFSERVDATRELLGQHAFDIAVFVCCGLQSTQIVEYRDAVESLGGNAATGFQKSLWIAAPPSAHTMRVHLAPFTGTRLAEFFRDMGYSVLLLVDDLARWNLSRLQIDRLSMERTSKDPLCSALFGCCGRVECLGGLNRTGAISMLAFHSNLSE